MNKNEAKRTLLRLFVSVFFCLAGFFSVQIRADDAFVVEEQAVIGGEEAEAAPPATGPVQTPKMPREATGKAGAPAKKSRMDKKAEKEPESKEEPVSVSGNAVSENTVSQNKVSPPFRTPVRKQKTKPEENGADKKKEIKTGEQTAAEKEKQEERAQLPAPWWLLGVGVVFFLCGCTRVARRAAKRKKNIIV